MGQDSEDYGDISKERSASVTRRLQSGGFFIVFIAIMMGLTALGMMAAESTSRYIQSSAASSTPEMPKKPRIEQHAPAQSLKLEPASPLKKLPEPTAQTNASSFAQNVSCHQSKKRLATIVRSNKLEKETTRHKRALWSLRRIGLVTRLLNPGMYSSEVAAERSRHKKQVARIHQQYKDTLQLAHCR